MGRFIDYTGKQMGKWTVLYRTEGTRSGHTVWRCKCECGAEKDVYATHIRQGNSKGCKQCCKPKGKDSPYWTGVGDISGDYFDNIRRGADGSKGRRKIKFDITKKYIWKLYEEQEGKCVLSGQPITIDYKGKDHTASLDRIDSTKGYIRGNVQWVHKHVNLMKNKLDQNYFIKLCATIANKHKS
jgi:hypothetical protein